MLKCATVNGARSLGLENMCGELKEGYCCDLIVLNLSNPTFDKCTDSQLIDAFVFGGASEGCVYANCVAGGMLIYG